jgi:hypothetical protein
VRSAEQEPIPDTRRVQPGATRRTEPELGSRAKKREDHVLVLGAIQGAGGIDETASGANEGASTRQNLQLNGGHLPQRLGAEAEAGIGAAAKGAQLGAGGIDEDAVDEKTLGRRPKHLDDGDPGPGGAQKKAVEALGVGVMGEEPALVEHLGADEEGLPAGPGAQVEHTLPGRGLEEEAEELAALVLDLEEAVAEGGEAIEVGFGADDVEGEGAEGGGAGLDALGEEARGEGFTGDPEPIHAKRNGAGDVEMGAEEGGLGAEFEGEVVGEPVREGEAESEGGGLLGDEGRRLPYPGEPSGLLGGEAGEQVEEDVEERRGGGLGLLEVEGEAAAPEGDVEDGLGEGLALLADEEAVGAEGAVEDALCGLAGEDGVEGLGSHGGEPLEGGPGERAETSERIKTGC